jgi:lipopolysaccharide transport system permease protein
MTRLPGSTPPETRTPEALVQDAKDNSHAVPALPVTIITRRSGWRLIDVQEMWRYRELLWFLAWRDLQIRYRQTVLGIAWALLQPFATMLVFSLFLTGLAGDSGIPYALFAYAGLCPWFFFANAITAAGHSVVSNQTLVTKVYFPRLLIPAASVLVALVDFAVSLMLLVGFMLYYGVAPGWSLAFVPVLVAGLAVAALGVGTLLAALTVAYRDFRFVLAFLVQLWLFATPSVYLNWTQQHSVVAWLLPLNPAHGLIGGFRSAALDLPVDGYAVGVSLAMSCLLFALGCLYFRRLERHFADII